MNRARLLLINKKGQIVEEYKITKPTVIVGRASQSNIQIESEEISRVHAQIIYSDEGFFISDMGSTNGTFLNGTPIQEKKVFQIYSNDTIDMGNVRLLFQVVRETVPVYNKTSRKAKYQVKPKHFSNEHQNQNSIVNDLRELYEVKIAQKKLLEERLTRHKQITQPMALTANTENNNTTDSDQYDFSANYDDLVAETSELYTEYIDSLANDKLSKKIEELYEEQESSQQSQKKSNYYQENYHFFTNLIHDIQAIFKKPIQSLIELKDNNIFLSIVLVLLVGMFIMYYFKFSPIFG